MRLLVFVEVVIFRSVINFHYFSCDALKPPLELLTGEFIKKLSSSLRQRARDIMKASFQRNRNGLKYLSTFFVRQQHVII